MHSNKRSADNRKNLQRRRDRLEDRMQNTSKMMMPGKSEFNLIEGEVLTIAIQRTPGTRGHFKMVLPVTFRGSVGLVAR